MRLLFIRHADPDYAHDALTEAGKKEAKALASFLAKERIDKIYVSPLGRAKCTLEAYLEEIGHAKEAIKKDWLREFDAYVSHDNRFNAWDYLPSTLEEAGEGAYSLSNYLEAVESYKNSDFKEKYDDVIKGLDEVLFENGYQREDHHYKVNESNDKTLAFFCHFGVTSMMVAHLINCSPINIAQYFCAAPSSISTFYSEERREGIAQFRLSSFGDTSHLALAGLKPSFSGRFSETFLDPRRHD